MSDSRFGRAGAARFCGGRRGGGGGWTDLDVLQRYLHPTDEVKRRAAEVISARQVSAIVAA